MLNYQTEPFEQPDDIPIEVYFGKCRVELEGACCLKKTAVVTDLMVGGHHPISINTSIVHSNLFIVLKYILN